MGSFIHDNFLLQNKTAQDLYHNYASKMPIYDYHCHLSPKDIAENRQFKNITELWLEGDHYKWRAMRAHGIDERFITGDASDKEKFHAWATTVPYTLGNALYHWTHIELKKYFGIDELLSEDNWESVWERCNELLQQDDYKVRSLITRSNVLKIRNEVNLFSMTRGINRFKGLVRTFELVAEKGLPITDISSVKEWTETTNELSNRSLEQEIAKRDDEQLKNTLLWSNEVNKAIQQLSGDDKPFDGAKEGLARINNDADIAIVSSANGEAVRDEWTRHGLTPYVSVLLGQEAGTKAHCIGELKKFGYGEKNILMVGDAPGDLDAAKVNGVFYYPILVGKETFSWERLKGEAMEKFLNGTYEGAYQEQLIQEFIANLQK